MLKPRYSVVIEVWVSFIKIRFGRPVDADVQAGIKTLENYEGVQVLASEEGPKVYWSPVYDCDDVVAEVISVLKSHGIESINILDGIPGRDVRYVEKLKELLK